MTRQRLFEGEVLAPAKETEVESDGHDDEDDDASPVEHVADEFPVGIARSLFAD